MTRIHRTGLALVAAMIAGPVLAQATPATPATPADASVKAAFERADTNKDGKLDKQEAATLPEIANQFDALDKNKDGALTLSEFAASRGKK